MLLVTKATPQISSVGIYVTFGILVLAIFGAWYGRHLVQTVADVRAAKARLAGARRARWGAWKVMLPVGAVIVIAADLWMRHG